VNLLFIGKPDYEPSSIKKADDDDDDKTESEGKCLSDLS
jgi:hypothetical protein